MRTCTGKEKVSLSATYAVCITISICALIFSPYSAQAEESWDDIWNCLKSSFDFPVDELKYVETDNQASEYFFGLWSADAGMSFTKERSSYSPVANADLKFAPIGNWFAEATFFLYLDKDEQKSWNPDFVYRFGYEDWNPYTLSLVYSNYAGNRAYSDLAEKYDKGTYALSWNFPLSDSLAHPFLIELDKKISCVLAVLYTPAYTQENGEAGKNQSRLKVTVNAPVYKGWYCSLSVLHYTDSGKQQPWDPDYTFEIGWRGAEFSVAYKNYSGNRLPWRTGLPHEGGPAEGSIGITWHWDWLK